MLRRMNTQSSSLVIFISILTILVQFICYQVFDPIIIIWGISCLMSVIGCHILLEQTGTYRICFDYSFLSLFISLTIILLTWLGNDHSFLPYTETMLGIAFINWLIPMLHCFLRYMLNYGSKVDDFNNFYLYSSIVFLISYTMLLIYGCFFKDAFSWAYGSSLNAPVFSPFEVLSVQIEDYLSGNTALKDIIIYLATHILIYTPYGFYIRLILRKQGRLLRFLLFLMLPLFVEVLQYLIISERCNLDDLVYGLVGGFLGCLVFFLTNSIFRAFSGRDFLSKNSDYRSLGSLLHF
jgi:glycopeptide antibiotics resistance protein